MTDTLKNIKLPANTWVDLYQSQVLIDANISVGTAISVQVLDGTELRFTVKATKPVEGDGYTTLTPSNAFIQNQTDDSGAWAYSPFTDSLVNVRRL